MFSVDNAVAVSTTEQTVLVYSLLFLPFLMHQKAIRLYSITMELPIN
jgi:hypothetical protein